jgi:hypothetical protein
VTHAGGQSCPPALHLQPKGIDHDEHHTINRLAPGPDQLNGARAARAGHAVEAFQRATGTDDADALDDLLADHMHWADRADFDFDAALGRARSHYAAETRSDDSRCAARRSTRRLRASSRVAESARLYVRSASLLAVRPAVWQPAQLTD